MNEKIRKEILSFFNDKISIKEDYYNSYKKEQLIRLFKLYALAEDNNKELNKAIILSDKNKKEVIEEFKKNRKKLYNNIIKCSDESTIYQLEYYLKKYKKEILEIEEDKLTLSLYFIDFLHANCLAKVNYSKSKRIITFYTPKEILKELENIIKNKKIKKIIKDNTKARNNIRSLLSPYGIISLKDLITIYEKIYHKIKEDDLIEIIIKNTVVDDDLVLSLVEDDYLIYTPVFENEEEALTFYNSLDKKLDYKIFNKKEYEELREGSYHTNYKEYQDIINYLETKTNLDENEIMEFDEDIILDYLYSSQKDEKTAKKNLKNNMPKIYGKLKSKDKTYITKQLEELSKYFPKFNYKGYSNNEINNKVTK